MSKLWMVLDSEKEQNPEDKILEYREKMVRTNHSPIITIIEKMLTLMNTPSKAYDILKDQSSSDSMDCHNNKLLFGED